MFSALMINPKTNPFSNTFLKTTSCIFSDLLTMDELANAKIDDLAIKIASMKKFV